MKAAILAVGSELLAPGRIEGHSSYLTDKLAEVGIPVVLRGVIGDDASDIADAVRLSLSKASLVLLTGGLGPTADDRSREGVCRAIGREMHLDDAILERIRARFERRALAMPEVNRRQAMVPDGAEVLRNDAGTAPGLWIDVEGGSIVLLPGPPRELRAVCSESLWPRLQGMGRHDVYRTLKLSVVGLPESSVEQRIGSFYQGVDNPVTTLLASAGQVEVRLTAHGATIADADEKNEALAAEIRAALGEHVLSEREETLEEVLGALLLQKGMTISVAESITGGLLGHRITQVPGSSQYFQQGFITYSNEAKHSLLGVPTEYFDRVGAVSEEVARAMAEGARQRARSDLALSVTGIAGPTGATETKPVGLVYVGLASDGGTEVKRYQFPGNRRQVKRWTSQVALNMARLHLLHR
jgi:nicotinamide-nucleotide amidase